MAAWNADPDNADHQDRPNAQALFLAVKSAHDNIVRYKIYHLSDPRTYVSNAEKISAYLCMWIFRFKVTELVEPDPKGDHEDVITIFLNGSFALFLARSLIGIELRTSVFFRKRHFDEFQYDLMYSVQRTRRGWIATHLPNGLLRRQSTTSRCPKIP